MTESRHGPYASDTFDEEPLLHRASQKPPQAVAATPGQTTVGIIEKAINEGVAEAVRKVVVRKLYSSEMQRALEAQITATMAEVAQDPSFKAEVRALMLKALSS